MSEAWRALSGSGLALPGWVASASLATGLLLVVALVVDRLLERRISAATRVLLYLAVAIRLALPSSWRTPVGLLGRAAGPATNAAVRPGEPIVPGSVSHGGAWWMVGYGLVAAALLVRWMRVRRALAIELRRAQPAPAACAARAAGRTLLVHPELGPLATGVWRPRIVIPRALLSTGEALGWVLDHEAAHLARGDQRLTAALQLACIAAWPVLPLWIAAARIRALIELAADERVLLGRRPDDRRRYAEVLVALADEPAAPFPAFGASVRGRLRALAFRRRWPPRLQDALILGVSLAALFACAGGPPGDDTPRSGDGGSLRAIVAAHQLDIKDCYQRWLDHSPADDLRALIGVDVGADGRVSRVRAGTSEAVLDACLVARIQTWRFPPPVGGATTLTFPVLLSRGGR